MNLLKANPNHTNWAFIPILFFSIECSIEGPKRSKIRHQNSGLSHQWTLVASGGLFAWRFKFVDMEFCRDVVQRKVVLTSKRSRYNVDKLNYSFVYNVHFFVLLKTDYFVLGYLLSTTDCNWKLQHQFIITCQSKVKTSNLWNLKFGQKVVQIVIQIWVSVSSQFLFVSWINLRLSCNQR